MIAGNMAVGFQ